jgi:hypothetical protein
MTFKDTHVLLEKDAAKRWKTRAMTANILGQESLLKV